MAKLNKILINIEKDVMSKFVVQLNSLGLKRDFWLEKILLEMSKELYYKGKLRDEEKKRQGHELNARWCKSYNCIISLESTIIINDACKYHNVKRSVFINDAIKFVNNLPLSLHIHDKVYYAIHNLEV